LSATYCTVRADELLGLLYLLLASKVRENELLDQVIETNFKRIELVDKCLAYRAKLDEFEKAKHS